MDGNGKFDNVANLRDPGKLLEQNLFFWSFAGCHRSVNFRLISCLSRYWKLHSKINLSLLGSLDQSQKLHEYLGSLTPTFPLADSTDEILKGLFPLANSLSKSIGRACVSVM